MTHGWLARHRRSVVGTGMAVWGAGLMTFLTLIVAYDLDFFGPLGGPWVLAVGVFAITGAIITWQRPDHAIGPLFLLIGLAAPVANALAAAAMGPFADHTLGLRALFIALSVAGTSAILPLVPLLIMIFPDGRPLSPRWRWIWWVTALASVIGAIAAFSVGAWGGDPDQLILGPPFDGRLVPFGEALSPLFFALIGVLLLAASVAAVLRYRRSSSTTRLQIKWLALAAIILVAIVVALVAIHGTMRAPPGTSTFAMATGLALVPISVTIAILRHRLYDIDLVLNRTIVFGALAVFITSLYVTVVVGVGTLIGDPSNVLLTVGATALVAAAFEPVRARVQHWANIAIFGRRASPYEVLASIVGELGSRGGEAHLEDMAALLADGTGAEHATVWVAVDGRLEATACWPPHDPAEHPSMPTGGIGVGSSEANLHLEPVHQDGEAIGALSLERRREDPITPREQRLVAELAGQASLILGNARLRARLRARLEELRASRHRLVATQDEERRRLERDLHDGAQQQLVALKVKLGMARTIAEKEGAGDTIGRQLQELSSTADLAVDGLRTLARGIYPPLLEAEGLHRAISAQASGAPLIVTVQADGIGRYPRQVEATIYFCVVEALGNSIRHADATSVEIVLEDRGEQVAFTLVDDGRGFDPDVRAHGLGLRNMADRIEASGGTLRVVTAPGSGVRIDGAIPLAEPTPSTPATSAVPGVMLRPAQPVDAPTSESGPKSSFGTKPIAPASLAAPSYSPAE